MFKIFKRKTEKVYFVEKCTQIVKQIGESDDLEYDGWFSVIDICKSKKGALDVLNSYLSYSCGNCVAETAVNDDDILFDRHIVDTEEKFDEKGERRVIYVQVIPYELHD